MNEIDEIKLIENEAFIDEAIKKCLDLMRDIIATRKQCDEKLREVETKYGQLLAHKVLFSSIKR